MATAPPAPAGTDSGAPYVRELREDLQRARELSTAGRPAQASRLMRAVRRRADRMGNDPEILAIVARTFVTESSAVLDMTGDLSGALDLLDQATSVAAQVGSDALLATVLAQRALLVLRSGDTHAALTAFDEAAAVVDAMEPRDRAIVMLNRGVLRLEHQSLTHAYDDLSRSVEYADQAGDTRLESMARHNLGYVDFLAGRIPRAIAAYREAGAAWPDAPHPAMLLDLARGLRDAGLVADADQVLVEAIRRAQEVRLFQDVGEAELVRAECALVGDDPRTAGVLARSARRRFQRRGNVRWQRKAELLVLRSERAALGERGARGRQAALHRLAVQCDDLAAACRRERRVDLAREADVLAAECRLQAGEPVDPGTARPRSTDPLPLRLQVRAVRALAARLDGDPARALREVRRGLDELGAFQGSLGSLDLRTAGARHGVALARIGLDMSLASGRPGDVLAMVERSRAISTRLPQLRPPDDEQTAVLLGELRRAEEEARGLEGDPEAAQQVARLRSRSATLQRDIRARAWELEGDLAGPTPQAPRLSHLRAAVRESGSVFVSYARHRGRWLAVVVRRGGARLHELAPTDEVAELVRRVRTDLDALAAPHLPGPIADVVRTSLRVGLARLDDLLLVPLELAGEPVTLSTSGPLSVLPWPLLPSRTALPTVLTPGAGTWLRGRAHRRPAAPRVVALAGPGLHQSEREARGVASTWAGADLVAGEHATTAAARVALSRADVLHVAAHGTHRHDNPLFSSLRLADGALYAYELDPGLGVPGCVTLSACEAGLATLRPGDEGLGLTHVLLHLGVTSVTAGVARVRDDVAAETMQRFHELLAAGASSAEALALAQGEGRDAPVPAPFVSFGSAW